MRDTSKFLNTIEEELFSKFLLLRDIIFLEIAKYTEMVKVIEKLPVKNSFKSSKKTTMQNIFVIPGIEEDDIEEAREYLHENLAKLLIKKSDNIREYCELDNISDDQLYIFIKSYIIKTALIDSNLFVTVSV